MEKKTIKKNDIYTIEIEDLSTDGSGIGKVDGYTLFVKDALIGDTAEVKVHQDKEALRLRSSDAHHHTVTGSCGGAVPACPQLRRMSDPAFIL